MASFQHKGRVVASWIVIILSLMIIGFTLVQRRAEQPQDASQTPQKTENPKPTKEAVQLSEGGKASIPEEDAKHEQKGLSLNQQEQILRRAAEALKPSYEALYADLIRESGWTDDQGARLIEILIEDQQEVIRESVFVAHSSAQPDLPTPGKLQARQNEVVEKIRKEFGDESALQYQEYQKTLSDRGLLLSLRRQFSPPLTPEQVAKTAKILFEERMATVAEIPSDPALHGEKIKAMMERVIHRLQPILSPDQVAVLRAHFDKMLQPSPKQEE